VHALRLAKHEGLGNDFLVALLSDGESADLERRVGDLAKLARETCDRRAGIGADGLILGTLLDAERPSSDRSAFDSTATPEPIRVRMKLLNSDGSSAEVSGNGMACLVHEVARGGVTSMDVSGATQESGNHLLEVIVETEDGSRIVWLSAELVPDAKGSLALVEPFAEVHMPCVALGPGVTDALSEQIGESFGDAQWDTGDVGNPHLVINAGRPLDSRETARLGAAYERHFPHGINVEFIWSAGHDGSASAVPTSIGMSVWERGAGLTQACGTGAVTAAVRARDWGLVEPGSDTEVEMPGGTAVVSINEDDGHPVLIVPVEHLGDYEWPVHAASLDA